MHTNSPLLRTDAAFITLNKPSSPAKPTSSATSSSSASSSSKKSGDMMHGKKNQHPMDILACHHMANRPRI
ncbi:hypothetical protein HKX48_003667 [Thoreauomyces humboldtii]|nr:hypothetical protein HKX48_003667 [Thoreauomyces humboldtii]